MSTLRISNIEAKSVPASATIDEKVKITNSSGDPLVFIDGKTSGITTVGINTTDPNITFDANSNVVVTGIITATKFSGEFEPTSVGIADSIFHTGDTDTVIRFPANNQIQFKTNDAERMIIGSSGNVTFNNELRIPDAIAHLGDNDTKIRFPADDTITLETAGSQRVGINSDRVIIGQSLSNNQPSYNTSTTFVTTHTNNVGAWNAIAIISGSSTGASFVKFGDKDNEAVSQIGHYNADNSLRFLTNGTNERLRVGAAGSVTHYCGSGNSDGFFVMGNASQGRTTLAVRAGNTNSNANSSFRLQHATGTTVGSLFLNHDDNNYNMMNAIVGGQIVFHTNESGSSLPKMRIHPDGDVQITSGNLVVASGNGIDFSATSDASGMTDELLDDYEEGSWTPTYDTSGSSGTITVNAYSLQYGKYVKIGKMVFVEGVLRANVTNNSNGTYDIGGLPFTVANTSNASGIIHGKEQSAWTVAPDHFSPIANTTRARARGGLTVGASAYTNGNTSGFNSGSTNNNRVYIIGSYRAEG